MTEPWDALYSSVTPIDPDQGFADRLRETVRSAALRGENVSTGEMNVQKMAKAPAATGAISPYLCVRDARAAIRWYVEVLGAVQVNDQYTMGDGRIGHAELSINGGTLMLADEHPEYGYLGPQGQSPQPIALSLRVSDVDGVLAKAREAGAAVEREPVDNPYGRSASFFDPFGHRWLLTG